MGMLDSLFGNKAVLNTALNALQKHLRNEGVSAIVLRRDDNAHGDTPGVDIKQYTDPIGIVDGQTDVDFVARCFAARDAYRAGEILASDANIYIVGLFGDPVADQPEKQEVSDVYDNNPE